jgi:hypothetical protein
VVIVEDGADDGVIAGCSAGLGASCFWHPANAKARATARTAMIAEIFFMLIHPLSIFLINCNAFTAISMNRMKNALQL